MKPRLSPATVIALVALAVSLTGTAFAAGVFTKKQKKQVTTIATKVFDSKIGGASVKRAESAERAETAAHARETGKVVEALRVTETAKAMQALRAPNAAKADFATTASEATRAVQALTATEAARAGSTGDADKLGGRSAGDYQRKISDECLPQSSVESISEQGETQCGSPILPFRVTPLDGQRPTVQLGNGLEMALACGGRMRVEFVNASPEFGNINFGIVNNPPEEFGAQPGITLDGARLGTGGVRTFTLPTRILHGQAVWVTPLGVTTVIFHGSDGNGSCELDAIALSARG
ncbi:MAG TPA: hypothetical protein VFX45_06250 [Solirubrobacterales bacterium]|nr:hypothetical protein [Solirubrobacterales bacterium]